MNYEEFSKKIFNQDKTPSDSQLKQQYFRQERQNILKNKITNDSLFDERESFFSERSQQSRNEILDNLRQNKNLDRPLNGIINEGSTCYLIVLLHVIASLAYLRNPILLYDSTVLLPDLPECVNFIVPLQTVLVDIMQNQNIGSVNTDILTTKLELFNFYYHMKINSNHSNLTEYQLIRYQNITDDILSNNQSADYLRRDLRNNNSDLQDALMEQGYNLNIKHIQQDPSEIFTLLIVYFECLSDDFKRIFNPIKIRSIEHISLMNGDQLRSKVTIENEINLSCSFDSIDSKYIDLDPKRIKDINKCKYFYPEGTNIKDLIQYEQFKTSVLENVIITESTEDQPEVKSNVNRTQTFGLPLILRFVLKRQIYQDDRMIKTNNAQQFPFDLNLKGLLKYECDDADAIYKLTSVICHLGETSDSGHQIIQIQQSNNLIQKQNDYTVTKVNSNDINYKDVQMLVQVKKSEQFKCSRNEDFIREIRNLYPRLNNQNEEQNTVNLRINEIKINNNDNMNISFNSMNASFLTKEIPNLNRNQKTDNNKAIYNFANLFIPFSLINSQFLKKDDWYVEQIQKNNIEIDLMSVKNKDPFYLEAFIGTRNAGDLHSLMSEKGYDLIENSGRDDSMYKCVSQFLFFKENNHNFLKGMCQLLINNNDQHNLNEFEGLQPISFNFKTNFILWIFDILTGCLNTKIWFNHAFELTCHITLDRENNQQLYFPATKQNDPQYFIQNYKQFDLYDTNRFQQNLLADAKFKAKFSYDKFLKTFIHSDAKKMISLYIDTDRKRELLTRVIMHINNRIVELYHNRSEILFEDWNANQKLQFDTKNRKNIEKRKKILKDMIQNADFLSWLSENENGIPKPIDKTVKAPEIPKDDDEAKDDIETKVFNLNQPIDVGIHKEKPVNLLNKQQADTDYKQNINQSVKQSFFHQKGIIDNEEDRLIYKITQLINNLPADFIKLPENIIKSHKFINDSNSRLEADIQLLKKYYPFVDDFELQQDWIHQYNGYSCTIGDLHNYYFKQQIDQEKYGQLLQQIRSSKFDRKRFDEENNIKTKVCQSKLLQFAKTQEKHRQLNYCEICNSFEQIGRVLKEVRTINTNYKGQFICGECHLKAKKAGKGISNGSFKINTDFSNPEGYLNPGMPPYYPGTRIQMFSDLSDLERMLLSPASVYACIQTIYQYGKRMKGNCISFNRDLNGFCAKLPRGKNDLAFVVIVNEKFDGKLEEFTINVPRFKECLKHLAKYVQPIISEDESLNCKIDVDQYLNVIATDFNIDLDSNESQQADIKEFIEFRKDDDYDFFAPKEKDNQMNKEKDNQINKEKEDEEENAERVIEHTYVNQVKGLVNNYDLCKFVVEKLNSSYSKLNPSITQTRDEDDEQEVIHNVRLTNITNPLTDLENSVSDIQIDQISSIDNMSEINTNIDKDDTNHTANRPDIIINGKHEVKKFELIKRDDAYVIAEKEGAIKPFSDLMCTNVFIYLFPFLFCWGKGDITSPQNHGAMDYWQWTRYIMTHANELFQLDPHFKFQIFNYGERKNAMSISKIYLHKNFENKYHRLDQSGVDKVKELIKEIETETKHFKGSAAYKKKEQRKAEESIRWFGEPALYWTLTYNDLTDMGLRKLAKLLNINIDVNPLTRAGVQSTNKQIIKKYLNLVVENFMYKLNFMINHIFYDIFQAENHWRVIEFQDRTSLHSHGLLWCKTDFKIQEFMNIIIKHVDPDTKEINQEKLNQNTSYLDMKNRILTYYDRLICVQNNRLSHLTFEQIEHIYKNHPVEFEELIHNDDPIPPHAYDLGQHILTPTLDYDPINDIMKLAISVQRHKCGKSCLKKGKCRFHVEDWKLCRETNLQVNIMKGIINVQIEFARNDFRMNQQNNVLMAFTRSNHDIKAVLNQYALVLYLTKYITKNEKVSAQLAKILKFLDEQPDLLNNNHQLLTQIAKIFMQFIGLRDYSEQEVMLYNLNQKLIEQSWQVLDFDLKGTVQLDLIKRTKKYNTLLDSQINRPEDRENMSFDQQFSNQTENHRPLRKQRVLNYYPKVNPRTEQILEKNLHAQQRILLHCPFRNLKQFHNNKKIDDSDQYDFLTHFEKNKDWFDARIDNYRKANDNINEQLREIQDTDPDGIENEKLLDHFMDNNEIENNFPNLSDEMSIRFDNDDDLELDINSIEGLKENSVKTRKKLFATQKEREDNQILNIKNENIRKYYDVLKQYYTNNPKPILGNGEELVLNPEQSNAYNFLDYWAGNNNLDKHVIISGPAGTGKSAILKKFLQKQGKETLICAYTAKVAFSSDGDTIHGMFNIPCRGDIMELPPDKLKILVEKFNGIKYLFIDEYSMIPAHFFYWIKLRCKEICPQLKCDFNFKICLFGDAGQLFPVKSYPTFANPEFAIDKEAQKNRFKEGQKIFNKNFKYSIILKEIMRVKKDNVLYEQFVAVMGRIHDKQSDDTKQITEDWKFLRDNFCKKIPKNEIKDYLHLFQRNKDVRDHNMAQIMEGEDQVILWTLNQRGKIVNKKVYFGELDEYSADKSKLANKVIKIGSPVIQLGNKDKIAGIVNNCTGVVQDIWQEKESDLNPHVILVKLDKFQGISCHKTVPNVIPVFIQGCDFNEHDKVNFPLMLGYAMTITKSQGMSIDQFAVDLKKEEQTNMIQTAFSRATLERNFRILGDFSLERYIKQYASNKEIIQKFYKKLEIMQEETLEILRTKNN